LDREQDSHNKSNHTWLEMEKETWIVMEVNY